MVAGTPANIAGNVADEVHYYDGGRWDDRADGHGASLELIESSMLARNSGSMPCQFK